MSRPDAWKPLFLLLILAYSANSAYRTSAWKNKLALLERDTPHLGRSFDGQRIAAGNYLEYYQDSEDPALKQQYLHHALVHAQTANKVFEANSVAHKLEGIIWFNLQEYDKSRAALLLSCKYDPASPEALEMLGDISYVEKKFAEAGTYYARAFRLAPASNDLVNKVSTAIYESGNPDSCLHYNLQLLQQAPDLYAPLENLGYYYLERKDTVNARDYFEKAMKKGLPGDTPL